MPNFLNQIREELDKCIGNYDNMFLMATLIQKWKKKT